MMSFWIHIIKKGIVMLALPNIAPGIEDRWYRKWLQKTFDKKIINYFTPAEDQMKILRKYPCYFDEFHVPKLDEVLYQEHLKIRAEKMLIKEENDEQEFMKLLTVLAYNYITQNITKMSFNEYVDKVLFDPVRDKPAISDTTLLFWVKEINGLIEEHKAFSSL